MRDAAALLLAVSVLAAGVGAAVANDSQAALGIGGLALVKSADIRMDSEELFISEGRVTVDYVFTNTSGQDIDTLVAFPLPDIENGVVEADLRLRRRTGLPHHGRRQAGRAATRPDGALQGTRHHRPAAARRRAGHAALSEHFRQNHQRAARPGAAGACGPRG